MGRKKTYFGLDLEQDGGYFYFILFFTSLSWAITIGTLVRKSSVWTLNAHFIFLDNDVQIILIVD